MSTSPPLIYQAEAGDPASLPLARAIAGQVTSPALQARAAALGSRPGRCSGRPG